MTRPQRPARLVGARWLGALLLTGCDFDVYSCRCPVAPTSATTRSRSRSSSRDVLDLVPKSTVKVNDVTVGQVTDIELDG